MSRMRRLKREKIKSTISGLALMIAIGVVGGVGSYAYFTDQADAKNDLVVTMGNLNVEIPEGKHETYIKGDTEKQQLFYIDNIGTLNQNVKLTIEDFKVNNSINNNVLNNIRYKLDISYTVAGGNYTNQSVYIDGKDLSKEYGTLDELNGKSGYLTNDKGELIILAPGTYITCSLITNIENSNKEVIQSKKIDFTTKVDSIQLGGVK